MRAGLVFTTVIMAMVGLVGCADSNTKCGNKVLALWPTEDGDYSFQEVILSTLKDPYSLSGGAAKIYYESLIGGNGFTGKVAQPRYTKSGDVCVPMDAASSMAVALYAQFERIMQFERNNGTLDMLSWPRRIGLDIHVRSNDGMTHNNAHYFGQGDSIAVLPYNLKGVPLALNPGIMAHEHFHGHFQRQVINAVNAQLTPSFDVESLFYQAFNFATGAKPTVEDVERGDLRTPRGLNAFVLRAWNEGLADLYGGIYSGNPRFFDESLPSQKEIRKLDAPLKPLMTAFGLEFNAQRLNDAKFLVGLSYDEGAKIARLMHLLAHSGVEKPEQFLVRVLRRLQEIPAAVVPQYDTKVLEFELIVPLLLKDFPLNADRCAAVRKTVSNEMMKTGFAQCPAI